MQQYRCSGNRLSARNWQALAAISLAYSEQSQTIRTERVHGDVGDDLIITCNTMSGLVVAIGYHQPTLMQLTNWLLQSLSADKMSGNILILMIREILIGTLSLSHQKYLNRHLTSYLVIIISSPLHPLYNITDVSLHWDVVYPWLQVAIEVFVVMRILFYYE